MTGRYTFHGSPDWDTHAVKRYVIHRDGIEVAGLTLTRDIPFHGSVLADLCASLRTLEDDAARLDLTIP